MAKRSAHADNLFVVRWGPPEAADTDEIKRVVPSLQKRVGKDLVYIAVMPGELANLDDNQRKLLMDLTEAVMPVCAWLIVVIEARGFRGAIIRSAMTAMSLLMRQHSKLKIVDTVEGALALAADALPERRLVEQVFGEVGAELGKVA